MTDTFFALIPVYGLWIVLLSVTLSCVALPIPSSLMVMAAGGFASAGDLAFWQLVAFSFVGFVFGDQIVYWTGRWASVSVIARFSRQPKTAAVVASAQALFERNGLASVFVSRTLLSPLGPYVGYLSGALRVSWPKFTFSAIAGALVWSVGYAALGFIFSDQIGQIASLIKRSIGLIMTGSVAIGGIVWLRLAYARRHGA
ncbi:hypothetical protein AB833_02560 [Chromatiales bacterium (ex Bugula neritina AB1)]|nr:hypothetical protein AB833_02560 [Chromatiales bacterium (ex Bugula neritina AB1)]